MVGIYKITSPSKKVYIGQSWDIRKRIWDYRCLDCKKQGMIYASLLKYGVDNHLYETIHELPQDISQDVLDIYEDVYMRQYRDCGVVLMNIKEAGSRGKHSEETKLKIGIKNKGRYIGVKRKPRTDTHRMNMSISQKGKKLSPEHLEKNRLSHIGLKFSEETKRKMSLARSGAKNPKSMKVLDTSSGKIYDSCRQAAKKFGVSPQNLSRYLRGERKNKTTLKFYVK